MTQGPEVFGNAIVDRSSFNHDAIRDTEDGVVIGMSLIDDTKGQRVVDQDYAQRELDKEVGYYFCKWLRDHNFPKVVVEARWSPANIGDPTERLELIVKHIKDE